MYAFDVHCNSFFPLFVSLYGARSRQPCRDAGVADILPLQWGSSSSARCCSRRASSPSCSPTRCTRAASHTTTTLSSWATAVRDASTREDRLLTFTAALPFLERTELFLYPVALLAVATPFSLLVGWNPTRFVLNLYFG